MEKEDVPLLLEWWNSLGFKESISRFAEVKVSSLTGV
jgi:hypothetical protein